MSRIVTFPNAACFFRVLAAIFFASSMAARATQTSMPPVAITVAVAPRTVSLPRPELPTALTVNLTITGLATDGVQLTTYRKFSPELFDSAGKRLAVEVGSNRSRLIRLEDCPKLAKGQDLKFSMDAGLYLRGGSVSLEFRDNSGEVTRFAGLAAGDYRLKFVYSNQQGTIEIPGAPKKLIAGIWIGEVQTTETVLTIKP